MAKTEWRTTFTAVILWIFAIIFGGKFLTASAANVSVPTKVLTTPAVLILTQANYRWYDNIDALTPSSTLAAENTAISAPSAGAVLRLRMNVADGVVNLASGATFKLQYANSTSGSWTDLSSSTAWTFFDNPSVADGQIIVTTVLSNSDVGESYGESNPSAATPNDILQNQRGEWDWVIENHSADTTQNWFFRMVYSSSTALDAYASYPKLTAVPAPPPPPPSSGGGGGGGGGSIGVGAGQPPLPGITTTTASGLPIPPPLLPPPVQTVDLSGDNRVDIVDLSILLYHYGESGRSRYDFNNDGSVGFDDISIMMFYWTS